MPTDNRDLKCAQCSVHIKGRAGKMYCSDQCRSTANNKKKLEDKAELLMRDTNRVLRHNRQVLHRASPEGKATVRRQTLLLAGFNFNYFTNIYQTQQGNTYYLCYDYGYMMLENDKVLIVNRQPYMEKNS
jgi:predicted nucleic acid-binding Zn ribbon protein